MSVIVPMESLNTSVVANDDTNKSPDRHIHSAPPEYTASQTSSLLSGMSKDRISAVEKDKLSGVSSPVNPYEHPLFPPLPSYPTPNIARNVGYYVIRAISSSLSVGFLSVLFIGALACTAGTAVTKAISKLTGFDTESDGYLHEEQKIRRQTRLEADRQWHIRQQMSLVDEEQVPDEYVPREGGKDPIVSDVGYYARRVGLDVETFRVQTEDGFIITLWHVFDPGEYTTLSEDERRERGPSVFSETAKPGLTKFATNRRYPVLLIHGLMQSAGAYCTNDDDSLAFYLCKSGYDVWLGNNRCGEHPEHTTLSASDPRMWAWDIRHLGTLDLTALTSRVLYETGFKKLGLVCHSQGTTETFVALAKEHRPELGERISVFCALAPAAYAGPLVSKPYFRFMQNLSPIVFRLVFGIHAFIPFMITVRRLFNPRLYGNLAYMVFAFLFGWSDARWDRDLRNRMFQFAPIYVSAECMRWWLGNESFSKHHCILSPRDEFEDSNGSSSESDMESGNSSREPLISRKDDAWFGPRTPPFAMWVGGSDALVDGGRLLRRFQDGCEPHVRLVHSKIIEGYEHLDVIWALDAIEQVGKEVRMVLWSTMPDEARRVCRVPMGLDPHLLELDVD
ncbi:hypothetical protein N7495_004774 [Penicillium taxi]|uniref:uncharacterized protein n=1 Tax=Penicillium taxi TaxID=168475 RepID=UPI002545AC58|nr:uncharacterized protein N7495_004774 [Penicillium taxi]KAJ5900030.1 hypothetical protein N7495_004774 [Penicillium taxi]